MNRNPPVRYRIVPARPEAHLFEVSCTVERPDREGQRFALPSWIPGSYLIRDFARHVVSIRAESRGRPVALQKLDKHTWRAAPAAGPLGLCSHEYFHAWNVKRIKPAAFIPYDLDRENYTALLWAFEGITSYYDDLALVRSGLISRKDYLELLGRSITDYLRAPGRRRQSLAESSFDAWIKYYRQDENSPNAMVSYYVKGSLVALCLDLAIRDGTGGKKSLDDIMRALWRRHGVTGLGVDEQGIERLAGQVTGLSLKRCFDDWLRSTKELPLKRLLATHGVRMELRPAESASDKGGKPAVDRDVLRRAALGLRSKAQGKDLAVTQVLEGGAAQRSGLAPGDLIVAVDGLRLGEDGLDAALARRRPGQSITVHAFRRDELRAFRVRLQRAVRDTCVLSEAGGARRRRLDHWLGRSLG